MNILAIFLFIAGCYGIAPQCRNENGEPVDWFYVYKLPREKNHPNRLIRLGVAHMYITPSTLNKGWIMSNMSIRSPNSMPGRTLTPMYQDSNLLSLIYNDQPPTDQKLFCRMKANKYISSNNNQTINSMRPTRLPNGKKQMTPRRWTSKGHTKGVILGDNSTSLWLVHSVPKFPPQPNATNSSIHYGYPVTGMKFGQSFLCVSVATDTLNDIALQLKYNEPLILHKHMPTVLKKKLPNLVDVFNNKTVDAAPWFHSLKFKSLAGREFLSFAKSAQFHDDLYSQFVSAELQSDLFVESWINGPGVLDSECNKTYQVINVEQIKSSYANITFSSHNDHSKWTVTATSNEKKSANKTGYWICVGDINRAAPQKSRGGGTVCTSDYNLWENYALLIDGVQACNNTIKYYN